MSDEKELIIVRGSTPLLSVTLPEDISTSDIATGIISISQRNKGVLISKTLDEMTVNRNKYSVFLKQSETLKLDSTKPAAIQAKFCTIDDIVLVSFIQNIEILPVNNEKLFEQDNPSGDTYEATGESGIEIVPDLVDFIPDMDVEQITISTDDYNLLRNKPVLNGVTINGNQTSDEFGIYNSEQVDALLDPIAEKDTEQDARISTLESVSDEHDTAIETIEGQIGNHTVARDVSATEYTNDQIDTKVGNVSDEVDTLKTKVNTQLGNHTVNRDVLSNEYTNAEIDTAISTAVGTLHDDVEALSDKVDTQLGEYTVARNVLADEYTNTQIDTKVSTVQSSVDTLSEKVNTQLGEFTVERNVAADEYTNAQIDGKVQAVQDDVDALDSSAVKSVNTIAPVNGDVTLSKGDIGLGNVTNDAQVKRTEMGTANGVATLDANGVIPSSQLPSYVDDVLEYDTLSAFPTTGESGKIYVALDTGKTYRWSGSTYTEISESLALGETSSTAYAGNKGKATTDALNTHLEDNVRHITNAERTSWNNKVDSETGKGLSANDYTTEEKNKLAGIEAGAQVNTITGVKGDAETDYRTGNVNITKENIGLGNVDNTSDLDKPISTATQEALDLKQNTLTFDTTPTAGSTNPVTSDGIASVVSALNSNLSQKVSSVNSETPDTNGNVSLNAEDIPADGVGSKDVSGNPIIVTDAVAENAENLSVDFEPIQDLHGYDHPWAGGAGKNLLVSTISNIKNGNAEGTWSGNSYTLAGVTWTFNVNDDGAITSVTANGTATGTSNPTVGYIGFVNGTSYILSGCPSDGSSSTYQLASSQNGATGYDRGSGATINATVTTTISSVRAYVYSGQTVNNQKWYPMLRLSTESDATFEPYTNICPITGRTQVDVNRTGKNLLKTNDDLSWRPSLTKNADGSIKVVGSRTSSGAYAIGTVDLKANTNYVLSASGNDDLYYQMFVNDSMAGAARLTDFAYTPTEDVTATIRIFARANIDFNEVLYPQLELGSTATEYEPYQEQSVTVNLGQTVYGGTLDVTTGLLTVETANIASYNGESIGEPWWSSLDEYVEGTTPTTGAQVVYTLATPTTVTLTPAQLALLEGYNILTTDGDTISLRYTGTVASNVQSEIDEFEESTRKLAGSLAMIETSPATANHAVGSYLMLNNRLCKVTSAIATGEQIIVGSNVQYTTVAEELTAILAQINA